MTECLECKTCINVPSYLSDTKVGVICTKCARKRRSSVVSNTMEELVELYGYKPKARKR